MTSYNGRCHCGQVEWTVSLEDASHVICHCDACKMLSGGPETLNQIVPKVQTPSNSVPSPSLGTSGRDLPETDIIQDSFKITKGSVKEYLYHGDSGIDQLQGKAVHCYYCPNCTTHPYHHQEVMGDKYVVRTILLDGAKTFKPSAEVYGKDRMAWEPEVATTFDTMPPS
ncbi:MAG: hypothetical protein M1817_003407 [Caeruleum heppii]|nr:MAG: hypothetical protein M1817_003407 [Caeruleum heppii]